MGLEEKPIHPQVRGTVLSLFHSFTYLMMQTFILFQSNDADSLLVILHNIWSELNLEMEKYQLKHWPTDSVSGEVYQT